MTFAVPMTYFGLDNPKGTMTNSTKARSEFLATLSSYGIDNLESYDGFQEDPTLTFAGTSITAQTDVDYVAEFAFFAVSGTKLLLDKGPAKVDGPAVPDVFTFSEPITAFGMYLVNGGDATTANTITVTLLNTLLNTSKTVSLGTLGPRLGFNNTAFFGITDTDPFNRIIWEESFDYDGILFDDIIAGFVKPVPEPSSCILLACAAAILYAARWHRPTKKAR
jgi:hypothetical protein